MKLSEHFDLTEFLTSETAMKNNFSEQYLPNNEVVFNLKMLANNCAEPIRAQFGSFSPTVAYRCKRVNDIVSKSKTSLHLTGCAFDETFIKNGVNISGDVFFWILKGGLKNWTELIWEFGDDLNPRWLHVGYDTKRLDKKVKVAQKTILGNKYPNYYETELYKKHKSTGKI